MQFTGCIRILFTDEYLSTVFGDHVGRLTGEDEGFDVYNLAFIGYSGNFVDIDIYLWVGLSAVFVFFSINHSPVLGQHLNTIQEGFK